MRQGVEVKLWAPGAEFDWVAPEGVGEDAGIILAGSKALKEGEVVVDVVGGELASRREVLQTVGRVVFMREVEIWAVEEGETVRFYRKGLGIREISARTLVEQQREREKGDDTLYGEVYYGESAVIVERFLWRPVMKFEEWVRKNWERFV